MNLLQSLYARYKEIVHYLIVGVLTTVVSLGVYYGLVLTVLDPGNPQLLHGGDLRVFYEPEIRV